MHRRGSSARRAEGSSPDVAHHLLPTYHAPTRPQPSGPGMLGYARPRSLCGLALLAIGLVLLLSASSRTAASSAFARAGLTVPHAVPDKLREGLSRWTGSWAGDGGSGSAADAETLEAGHRNDVFDEVEVIMHPDDPLADAAIGAPAQHWPAPTPPPHDADVVDVPTGSEPLYHATNGYYVLPSDAGADSSPPRRHPIFELMEKAEAEWDAKVARQSRTLADAVVEYRRRYRRPPPRGFDKWWAWAQRNRVVLVDEYDQILHDIEPFFALDPRDFAHRLDVMTQREESFTMTMDPTAAQRIAYSGPQAALRRAHELGDIIERFVDKLPGTVQMTFTRHDQPACSVGWAHQNRMLELASEGEYISPSEFIETDDPQLTNWANGCSPHSPLRQSEMGLRTAPSTDHRSFIFDHQAAMDICQHPETMPLHGFTLAVGTNLAELVPLFTFAKTTVHNDILATPLEQYSPTYIGDFLPWEQMPINKLLWRGSTTGSENVKHVDWQASQRARMHFMTHETQGEREVMWADEQGNARLAKFPVKLLNEYGFDAAFAGEPLQCDEETCKLMEEIIDFEETMGLNESYDYKYLVDVRRGGLERQLTAQIDGNGWSGRFHRLMSTNSAVLKTTIFPEWYSSRVQPWLQCVVACGLGLTWLSYIPLKVDYSDLYDIMTFFVGRPDDGRGGHDELGHKIAEAGRLWARDHEDMASYMYRLLLEWSRVSHRSDGESWDYLD